MAQYRILEETNDNNTRYCLQKKVWFWFWWYNPDNINGWITGWYDTEEKALESYHLKTEPFKTRIIPIQTSKVKCKMYKGNP